ATRLTLVSAPPGCGKSVAVAGWLAASGVPSCWLSLDAADNDPARLRRYLLAALEGVRPGVGALASAHLGDLPPLEQAALLIDAMAASDQSFALVLDDYHVITAEPVHALLRALIEHGPPFAHIVIVTREDPPLPLPRLRAHGRLVEVRAHDLHCTPEEAAAYLGQASGVSVDGAQVGQLVDRTEGWMAGLQLAAISLRDRPSAPLIDAFSSSQRHVLDYLATEVVDGLDPAMRSLLVRSSVAERFTPRLCDRLTGRSDSAQLLDAAERMNLFLIPLDDTCCWYRFHHLFADYLRSLLEPEEEPALREVAAEFFEEIGYYEEAIAQAISGGSTGQAVRLLEAHGREVYEAGQLSTLVRWVGALPADAVGASGELCALWAWSAFHIGRVGDALHACEAAEAARRRGGGSGDGVGASGSELAVRAAIAARLFQPAAVEIAERAVAATSDDPFYGHLARVALAGCQLSSGRLEGAEASARTAMRTAAPSDRSMIAIPPMTALASSLGQRGQRSAAEALCRETLAVHHAEARHLGGGTPYAMYWLGRYLYEAGQVQAALEQMERGWAAMGTFGFGRAMLTTAVASLALARRAAGRSEAALEAVRTVRRDASLAGLTGIDDDLAEIAARIQVMDGDMAAAARWAGVVSTRQPDGAVGLADGTPPGPDGPAAGVGGPGRGPVPGWRTLDRSITLARVRMAQGRCEEAEAHLREARATAEAAADVADLISIEVVEAAVALRAGDRGRAMRSLEVAVRRAAPEGFVRRIVDDGGSLAPLLPAVRHVAPAFVDLVLDALAAPTPVVSASGSSRPAVRVGGGGPTPDLAEPLTDRELEVLRLIASGRGDAAVAEALVVSLATAKWHAAHIRAKLGVTSRTQAVLRAQELALV
ncbi:MAG TPA: LuxR C-terminal-related transcriptional regulator, partial [Candidatus Limnocylindrales bacterium]